MKKFIANFLLIVSLASFPKIGYAKKAHLDNNEVKIDVSKLVAELKDNPQFLNSVREACLELSKDKKFTDKIVKNYEQTHKEAIWVNFIKFPFRLIWKTIKITFNYIIGKNVAETMAKLIPIALLTIDARYKFPATRKIISWIKYILLPH